MPVLEVYSRRGCHLCEILIEGLLPLARGRAEVRVLDVDEDDDARDRYGALVPVVLLDGRELCRYELDADAVRAALAA